jgi:hypothetical protein
MSVSARTFSNVCLAYVSCSCLSHHVNSHNLNLHFHDPRLLEVPTCVYEVKGYGDDESKLLLELFPMVSSKSSEVATRMYCTMHTVGGGSPTCTCSAYHTATVSTRQQTALIELKRSMATLTMVAICCDTLLSCSAAFSHIHPPARSTCGLGRCSNVWL